MRSRGPTLRDVAARAGVSVATVSYVLRGRAGRPTRVSTATEERVLAAASELGYAPNPAARGLRTGRIDQVCLVTRLPDSPWMQRLAADLATVARAHDNATVIFASGDWQEYLRRRSVDGAIIDPSPDPLNLAHLRLTIGHGLALVVLSNGVAPAGFDVLGNNEYEVCREAMLHLANTGRRRIAFLRHWPDVDVAVAGRLRAYREVIAERGLDAGPELIRDTYGSRERAYSAALDLLNARPHPDAIFAGSDLAAISALWAAHRLGRRVPDDVAIIGVGNAPETEFTDPALSTVGPARLDFTDVAEALFDRIARPGLPGRRLTQRWSLIQRGTS